MHGKYSNICGRVIGYQHGSTDDFYNNPELTYYSGCISDTRYKLFGALKPLVPGLLCAISFYLKTHNFSSLFVSAPKCRDVVLGSTDRPWMKLKVHKCACVYVKHHHMQTRPAPTINPHLTRC